MTVTNGPIIKKSQFAALTRVSGTPFVISLAGSGCRVYWEQDSEHIAFVGWYPTEAEALRYIAMPESDDPADLSLASAVTTCCHAYATYSDDGILCCKGCWREC